MIRIVLAAFLLIGMADKHAPLILSADEQKSIAAAQESQQNWLRQIQAAENAAWNAPLKCESAIAALGDLQRTIAMKLAADSKLDSVLSSLRLAHSCADCELAPDNKFLVRKEVK